MSLYSYDFQLLTRPARGAFSFGPESTRLILPDFDNVAQLGEFTHRILYWKPEIPGVFTQLKVGASFVCLLIIVVQATLARRLYERSLWFVRIIKRPEGNILVVSAVAYCGCYMW